MDESVLSAFDDTFLEKSTILNTEASDVKLAPKASISVKKQQRKSNEDVTKELLQELYKDKKAINLQKVLDIFKDSEKVKEIDVKK